MHDADIIIDPSEVELDPASQAFLDSEEADKTTRVNVETVREFSQRKPEGKPKRIIMRFLASPVEITGDGKVEGIVIGRNELVEEGGSLRARDTGEREELECGLVLRSVGYTGVPIEGVPFDDQKGTILNDGGRVLDSHDGGHKGGHYTAGWIKRGPSGVIGTNKKDALETVRHLLEDVASGGLLEPSSPEPAAVEELLAERGVRFISFEDWQAIDRPRSAAASPTAAPGSSSSRSRRCSTCSASGSASSGVADLAEIQAMIEAALPGAEVEVSDQTGTGDHLEAVVTAPQFEGLSRIEQHRLVKAAVRERMDDGAIHALTLKTRPSSGDQLRSPHARERSQAAGRAADRREPGAAVHEGDAGDAALRLLDARRTDARLARGLLRRDRRAAGARAAAPGDRGDLRLAHLPAALPEWRAAGRGRHRRGDVRVGRAGRGARGRAGRGPGSGGDGARAGTAAADRQPRWLTRHPRTSPPAALAVVLVAAALLGGCGGDGGSASSTAASYGPGIGPPRNGETALVLAARVPEAGQRAAVARVLRLIAAGDPLPYEQDGSVFQNREGNLPDLSSGLLYREYTVPTPGSPDRGARRLVVGDDGSVYYTSDHYSSFTRLDE